MNNELTIEQRLEAYKWAKENFRDFRRGPFLCCVLDEWFGENIRPHILSDIEFSICFPEMAKRKPELPEPPTTKWFLNNKEGNRQREALLDKCIKECEEKLLNPHNQ